MRERLPLDRALELERQVIAEKKEKNGHHARPRRASPTALIISALLYLLPL